MFVAMACFAIFFICSGKEVFDERGRICAGIGSECRFSARYFPLSLWSWQDTVKAVWSDRVTIISEYDQQFHRPA